MDWLLWIIFGEALNLPYTLSVTLEICRPVQQMYLYGGQLFSEAKTPMSHDEALRTFGAT